MQSELVRQPFAMSGGTVAVPNAPGLGVEVDEDIVRRYTF